MTTMLDNPLVQSALLPFIVALVLAIAIGVIAPRWQGLAVPSSFYLAALLISGAQILPLTSTRKILLLGLVAVIVEVFFALRHVGDRQRYFLLIVICSVAVSWILWPLLLQSEGLAWVPLLAASLFYMLWSTLMVDSQPRQTPIRLLSLVILSGGVAIVATLGSSALLGQLAGAMAAALGGLLFVRLIFNRGMESEIFLPAILITTLLGLVAVVYASLAWQSLLFLMFVPLVSRIPLAIDNIWFKLSLQVLIMSLLVAGAIMMAWGNSSDTYY